MPRKDFQPERIVSENARHNLQYTPEKQVGQSERQDYF